MKKIAMWSALAFSLLFNFYFFFRWFDAGVMLENSRDETRRQRARNEINLAIINRDWIGRRSDDFSSLSKDLEKKGAISGVEGGALKLGDLIFETRNGIIVRVKNVD